MISLDLTKSSEVRIAGDRPKCSELKSYYLMNLIMKEKEINHKLYEHFFLLHS